MPELPDVESFRRYFDENALDAEIQTVRIYDERALGEVSRSALQRNFKGRRFRETRRHGKWLLALTNDAPCLALHFGMTGHLHVARQDEQHPTHTRVAWQFTDGRQLDYVCQRLLGRVTYTRDPNRFIAQQGLGPDALDVAAGSIGEIIGERSAPIKAVLMNQEIISGLGNIYADEVLFQARVDPKKPAKQLTDEQLQTLGRKMHEVLTTAIDRGADARDLPQSWLIHSRGEGRTCPNCGGELKHERIRQRTTWHCPRCQKG